jgi:sulfate permease, SulP family
MNTKLKKEIKALKPRKSNLQSDLIAGLTFAVVNVPQSMAHALLASVNPVFGIYTLMVALPVGAVFASSVYMNVSTTGALSVAAGAGLAGIPADQRVQALVTLVFIAGLIQLLAGVFKLGFVIRFISNSVMTGFLNGVAVLIILGQLGDLTGYVSTFSNSVARTLDLLLRLGRIDFHTTIIGLLTLAIIVFLLRSKWGKYSFIVAIASATVLLTVLSLPGLFTGEGWQAVKTVGDIASIPRSLPGLGLPDPGLIGRLILPAFSVAVIGLIQGAGVSESFPNPNGKFPDVSRDFLGQGAANIATSFVGGIPAGGSISGTNLIKGAGSRSRWANIFAGFLVVAVVLLIAPFVEFVPMPALAALLIVAGFQGLRIEAAKTVWQTSKVSITVMLITFISTLFIPLHYAVLIGIALSIVLHVIGQSNKIFVTEWVLFPGGLPEERPAPRYIPSNKLTLLQVYGSLFFAAAKNFEDLLPEVDKAERSVVAIGLRGKTELSSTFINVLERYALSLKEQNSKLMLVGVDHAVYDQLQRTGVLNTIGEDNIFFATQQLGEAVNRAAAAAYAWLDQNPAGQAIGNPIVK